VEPGAKDQPINVLLFTLDTLRADALGAYDPELRTSPNIDRLAAEGVLFEQAASSAPSTLPSHSTILTGKHPYSHGARSNSGYVLAAENVTLAERFKAAGYVTAAEIAAPVISARTQINQGFDQFTDPTSFEAKLKTVTVLNEDGTSEIRELTERDGADITRRGIEFLRANRDRPFFLWLHYFDPHVPYAAPPNHFSAFPGEPYKAEVAHTDEQVGRVIRELETLGIANRTLVILTSDHGEGLGEHGEQTHAYLVYETTIRVPLILWGPSDLPQGQRIQTLALSADIAPTALDWAGLAPLENIQGQSLRNLIEGGDGGVGYGESIEPLATFGASPVRYVRVGSWKYIHSARPELYDVVADHTETTNLAEQNADKLAELRSILRNLIENAAPSPDAEVAMTPEVLAQLDALGYVAAEASTRINDELATLDVSGTDMRQITADYDRYARAWTLFTYKKDYEKANEEFSALLERYPTSVPILSILANTNLHLEKPDLSAEYMRRAIELAPDSVALRRTLSIAELQAGNVAAAEEALVSAIGLEPCGVEQVIRLSNLYAANGRHAEQKKLLDVAVHNCPDPSDFENDYAYLLATAPDATLRDGQEALRIARKITRETSNPAYLDTLAAAYAENGEFDKAIETQRQAITLLATRAVAEEVIDAFRANLAGFEAGRPVRSSQ
jgi:arylsulfatase A-like enzyme/Flp pilus assembly protein TadD